MNTLPPHPLDVDKYGPEMAARLADMARPIRPEHAGAIAIPTSRVERLLQDLAAKDKYIDALEAELRLLRGTHTTGRAAHRPSLRPASRQPPLAAPPRRVFD